MSQKAQPNESLTSDFHTLHVATVTKTSPGKIPSKHSCSNMTNEYLMSFTSSEDSTGASQEELKGQ